MARVQLLLCFTLLIASVTFLDLVSATLNFKPSLPQIEDPKTVKDVEPYTVKVVMVFVADLEKQCPKTNKFKAFFEKLRGYAKYVCPISRRGQVDYEKDMKAKAGGLFQAISSFAIGKIRQEIQEEKMEAINTFRFMKSVAAKILGGFRKEESQETMKLTSEQQKEIKEGILKWETVITRITSTMVMSTTTNSSSGEVSKNVKEESNGNSKSTGNGTSSFNKGASFDDSTGATSTLGSPSASPLSSPSGSTSFGPSGSETPSKDTSKDIVGGIEIPSKATITGASGTISKDTTTGGSSKGVNVEASQSGGVTVTQVEAETSKEISSFLINLEKKCPPKEEFKAFFVQLKGTMIAPAKERKGLFTRIKSAAGKISGAMAFIKSRIGGQTAEVRKSMESYQEQVMKTLKELETIHSQIVIQNKGKKEGTLTCTPAQQIQIKQTITKWEQVTTQFVEIAVKNEKLSSSSSFAGKIQAN